MPVDIKTLAAEVEATADTIAAAFSKLHAQVADLEARVGNVPDEDAAKIRSALAKLKALVIPPPVVPNIQTPATK